MPNMKTEIAKINSIAESAETVLEGMSRQTMTVDAFLKWLYGSRDWMDDRDAVQDFSIDGKPVGEKEEDLDELHNELYDKSSKRVEIFSYRKSNWVGAVKNVFKIDGKSFSVITDNLPLDEDGAYWN